MTVRSMMIGLELFTLRSRGALRQPRRTMRAFNLRDDKETGDVAVSKTR